MPNCLASITSFIAYLYETHPCLMWLFKILGLLWILLCLFDVLQTVWKYLVQRSYNLFERYGDKDAYAIIIGDIDDISFEYEKVLAENKFNLLLISNDKTKLESRRKALIASYSDIRIRIFVFDFDISFTESSYQPFMNSLKDINIAILINNFSNLTPYRFHQCPTKKLLTSLNINIEGMTFVNRLIIPEMLKKEKRCAIVTLSSLLGDEPIPYCGLYSASKAYQTYFTNALALEYQASNIDILNCRTGQAELESTALATHTPEEAAKLNLQYLGRARDTYGSLKNLFTSFRMSFKGFQKRVELNFFDSTKAHHKAE